MNKISEQLQKDLTVKRNLEEIKDGVFRLGEFHNHFNRKEKIMFSILERRGGYAHLTRAIWRIDDTIRGLYLAIKKQLIDFSNFDVTTFQKSYHSFQETMNNMIFLEENIVIPILQLSFTETDWYKVSSESDAFGYTLIELPKEIWGKILINIVQ